MKVTYATRHRWVKHIAPDILSDFGKNDRARLRSLLGKVPQTSVRTEVSELDQGFLDFFLPLYEERIREKRHPTIFSVRERTLGNTKRHYHRLSLTDNGVFLGGVIFSVHKDRLSLAYRTFSKKWAFADLRASPSLYVEYCIAAYARELGLHTLVHGRDRNPYGQNSDIGLAAFKLSVGCSPSLAKSHEVKALDTDTLTEDTLIFEYPQGGKAITHAYLVTKPETESHWGRVTMYPERLRVDTIYRE